MFQPVTPYLKENAVTLQLSGQLLVSKNFVDTFADGHLLHGKAKKPMEYVLIRRFGDEVKALIITQAEADELAEKIKEKKDYVKITFAEQPKIWIQTINGSLYAGSKPENMPGAYSVVVEQLHFLNGEIETLAEKPENNLWFTPESYKEKLEYFKLHIAPDEPLNAENLTLIEKQLAQKMRAIGFFDVRKELAGEYSPSLIWSASKARDPDKDKARDPDKNKQDPRPD